jgi:hypothetical protein
MNGIGIGEKENLALCLLGKLMQGERLAVPVLRQWFAADYL